jgi:cell shape-determining protein MreD
MVGIAMFFLPEIVLLIDPTGAPVHQDIWQFILIAACATFVFSDLAFLLLYINQPGIFQCYADKLDDTDYSPWLGFAWVALFMLTACAILNALLA